EFVEGIGVELNHIKEIKSDHPIVLDIGYDITKRGYQNIDLPNGLLGDILINFSIPDIIQFKDRILDNPIVGESEDAILLKINSDQSIATFNVKIDIKFNLGLNDNFYKG